MRKRGSGRVIINGGPSDTITRQKRRGKPGRISKLTCELGRIQFRS